jgi:uncharacterized protein YeaO (DUF488 family)
MRKRVLCTIGYAGLDDDSFLVKLRLNGVQVLVDVLSLRELGVPADLRKSYREGGGGLDTYLEAYRKLLGEREVAMSGLSSLIGEKTCCLLCLEHEPSECHRSVLAQELSTRHSVPLKVVHIQ